MFVQLKRKLITMKKVNTLFFFVCFGLINFIALGYSALSQNLMITGDVGYFLKSKKLYDILMKESRMNRLAREYTGVHQDSFTGIGDKAIFYYYATTTAEGDNILNRNNVIFAGQCWQMIRTTDTGGVKMIYNGEPVNNQCLNTRGTHVGYSGRASQTLNSSYYYGTNYTYDSENQVFQLTGSLIQATWNSTIGPTLVGKYTCKSATKNGTCATLYLIESYSNETSGYALSINANSSYSQFGILPYNTYNTPGYMYNSLFTRNSGEADSGSLFGTEVSYSNGTYTLTNTSTTYDSTHHYTCNNASGTCSTVRYYYYNNNYAELSNGRNIEQVLDDMLYATNVNQKNSIIKTGVEAWYQKYLSNYDNYIEDTIYCNNRTITSLGGWNPNGGATSEPMTFEEYTSSTDLSCDRVTDQFSISNSSAPLTHKVGLISTPEMNLLNNNNARITGDWYWLLSPTHSYTTFFLHKVTATGELSLGSANNYNSNGYLGVRPAISLVSGTEYVSGDGTMANPYIVDDSIANTTWDYSYTGSEQIFTAPEDGIYKLEAWGAQGGGDANASGGKGGYTAGIINLNKDDKLYIYVGQEGLHNATVTNVGGWNGGGYSGNNTGSNAYGGGGSTDYRLVSASTNSMTAWNEITSLRSRIMVAGGGGGNFGTTNYTKGPGVGGNLTGGSATGNYDSSTVTGGSQVAGGTNSAISGKAGLFGSGVQTNVSGWGGGGGGGYWGGATGNGKSGGGGSSYISGYLGSVAVASSNSTSPRVSDTNSQACTMSSALTDISCSYHYSNYIFEDTIMRSGAETQPTHNGTSTMTGNSGDGYAKITILDQHLVTITPEIAETGTVSPTSKVVGHGGSAKFTVTPSTGYVYVSNTCGGTVSGNTLTISNVTSSITCTVTFGEQTVFDYTGDEQTFVAPKDGIYRLEVWGAQGGNAIYGSNTYTGGYGSYSVGDIYLTQNTVLYVNTGGKGGTTTVNGSTYNTDSSIGYNGGGYSAIAVNNSTHSGGGGATHIATISGLLSTLSSNQSSILIVAGGGGGASSHSGAPSYSGNGGHGGGIRGNNASPANSSCYSYGMGATQTAVGGHTTCTTDGHEYGSYTNFIYADLASFGLGENYSSFCYSNGSNHCTNAGGGGGFYGGGAGWHTAGGGGSGYIGKTSLFNKHMACYNCTTSNAIHTKTISNTNSSSSATADKAKIGNGYAKITFIDDETYTVTVTSTDSTRGTVTPSSIVVNKGATAFFTITPNTGYKYYTNSCGGVFENNVLTIANVNENITCSVEFKTLANFNYTGGEQTFTVPEDGIYKLEVWGAQGGSVVYNNINHEGGYGAYSTGNIYLNEGETLYINVGEAGKTASSTNNAVTLGTYNGGGNNTASTYGIGSTGGGATHIALSSGLLSSFENSRSNILIVAGAGGGSGVENERKRYVYGGSGGGIAGNASTVVGSGYTSFDGATQTQGYGFGLGQNSLSWTGGGGSGYYGGYGYVSGGPAQLGGSGGSGYIGNSSLFSKHMTCYNCTTSNLVNTKTISNTNVSSTATSDYSKTGNGYARITFVETDTYTVNVTSTDTTKGTVNPTNIIAEKGSSIAITLTPATGYKYYSNTCGGSVSNNVLTISNINNNITCTVRFTTLANFDYTGGQQTFTAPEDGLYKLEVWGAQGGSYGKTGGYGSYSVGEIVLAQNHVLYINVGQQSTSATGGYNGGGTAGANYNARGGGGATHMANASGTLASLSGNNSSIIIVAGGGGGSDNYDGGSNGGNAGGYIGNNGSYHNYSGTTATLNVAKGGTQTAGGAGAIGACTGTSGAFGQGGSQCSNHGGGGGAGYYGGGGGAYNNSVVGSGAGGSGYIGNTALLNKHMTCYSCSTSSEISTKTISNTNVSATATADYSKSGNGYAKITFIEDVNLSATYTLTFDTHDGTACTPSSITAQDHSIWGTLCTTTKSGYVFKEWNTAADGSGTAITSNSIATSNLTVHAIWIPVYRITYNSNGGSVCDPTYKDQIQGTAWGTLCNPIQSGYGFRGWNTAQDGSGTTITSSSIASSNLTVYAQWIEITTTSWTFSYTGGQQTFTAPYPGTYKIELYGAQGTSGGRGAYVYGNVELNMGTTYYIYVGGSNGWNGGGSSGNGGHGGGATDIRLTSGNLYSRIMVAGGGGSYSSGNTTHCDYPGSNTCGQGTPGAAGLTSGSAATYAYQKEVVYNSEGEVDRGLGATGNGGGGGSQTGGGGGASGTATGKYGSNTSATGGGGSFGNGGSGTELHSSTIHYCYSGAGGGGYWGGGGGGVAMHISNDKKYVVRACAGGGGGSSYINGVSGYTRNGSATYAANQYVFTSSGGSAGNRSGNGYASITYIG